MNNSRRASLGTEQHLDDGAAALACAHVDASAVGFDEPACDVEPETEASVVADRGRAFESLEDGVRLSRGMPTPASMTRSTASSPTFATSTRTGLFAPNLIALSSRLLTTCSIRRASRARAPPWARRRRRGRAFVARRHGGRTNRSGRRCAAAGESKDDGERSQRHCRRGHERPNRRPRSPWLVAHDGKKRRTKTSRPPTLASRARSVVRRSYGGRTEKEAYFAPSAGASAPWFA